MKFITRRALSLIAVILLVAGICSPVLAAGARPTFTWQKPANFVTFNSITDNPAIGNEEQFLAVRDLKQAGYAQSLKVTDGQQIVFRIYYDNNAGHNLNLTAKNTKVSLAVPAKASKQAVTTAYVSADNSRPQSVSASASVSANSPFSLQYEKGSAQIWNNTWRGKTLDDSIVSSGVLVGYKSLNGQIPGGSKYSGYVTAKFKVNFEQNGGAAAGAIGGSGQGSAGSSGSGKGGQPTAVPNTGPGDTVAIFLAASAVGFVAHTSLRRRSRQGR